MTDAEQVVTDAIRDVGLSEIQHRHAALLAALDRLVADFRSRQQTVSTDKAAASYGYCYHRLRDLIAEYAHENPRVTQR